LLHALNGIPSLQYEEQGYGVECAIWSLSYLNLYLTFTLVRLVATNEAL
jgi:hypothetical protein